MKNFINVELKHLKKINKDHIDQYNANYENTANLIRRGIIIEPVIPIDKKTSDAILDQYGFNFQNANSTFYKTFEERYNKPWIEVVVDRLIHYATGGAYISQDADTISDYVNTNFVKIDIVSADTIKEDLQRLVNEPFALPTDEIPVFCDALLYYEIKEVKGNKELQIRTATENQIAIKNPELFLRQLYYAATDKTILIKSTNNMWELASDYLMSREKQLKIATLLSSYEKEFGLEELAKHFRPDKKVWLLIRKQVPATKRIINKIKRLSENLHVDHTPKTIVGASYEEISKLNVYQLIKAFNYVREQRFTQPGKYIQAYKVRNGKVFVAEKDQFMDSEKYVNLFATEINIARRLNELFKNTEKKIYLGSRDDISIKMPTSGKSFIGNYPMYTSVTPTDTKDKPMQVGIYWNTDMDLDLHAQNIDGRHIGFYSERDSNITYSGDMVRLNSKGFAAESMLIRNPKNSYYTFNLQPFSTRYQQNPEAMFFLATSTDIEYPRYDDIVKPKELVFSAKIPADPTVLGVTIENKFVFTNMNLGGHLPNENVSSLIIDAIKRKEHAAMTIQEFCDITETEVVDVLDEDVIDFSYEKISTNSFMELLSM